MTGAGSEKSARLLFCLGLDAPFLDPRDQHPGVEQARFYLRCGLRGAKEAALGARNNALLDGMV
jgi:hypothetical protein